MKAKWYQAEGDLVAAEARLQQTADVAATRHRFGVAALALHALAGVQTARGAVDQAEATRRLAAQAEDFAGGR